MAREVEWSNFGEERRFKEYVRKMLDEGLDVLNGLWTGEPFEYHGEHFKVGESQFSANTNAIPTHSNLDWRVICPRSRTVKTCRPLGWYFPDYAAIKINRYTGL